jgi:hypothetical protein
MAEEARELQGRKQESRGRPDPTLPMTSAALVGPE